jgi:hypothetical protein
VAAEAACLTIAVAMALRWCRFERVAALCARVLRSGPRPAGSDLDRAVGMVEAVTARLSGRCLTRALVLQAVLGRRGAESDLCIGAARRNAFRAHAWVERGGAVVGRQGPGGCETLYRLPARPRGAGA